MNCLRVVKTDFCDEHGLKYHLRGINLSGDSKFPRQPDIPTHVSNGFWNTEAISFVGRPFPLAHADQHLGRIASWGYNVVRLVFTWEALEHAGPGQYDKSYADYIVEVIRKCSQHKLYVIMDPHQDVWSRYSGGSGAPYWTFIAAGLNPQAFAETQAAVVHNTYDRSEEFPRMIWSTNYDRFAAATMFVLFFAGSTFAPKAIIDGVNISDYLQEHFIDAVCFLAHTIYSSAGLDHNVILGWESMNEPSSSWIGLQDLMTVPKSQHLRKGTCPSPFDAILTASGISRKIDVWDFGPLGPKRTGSTLVNPGHVSVWSVESEQDQRYLWTRDAAWDLDRCIWAQHGVWCESTKRLLIPDYFACPRASTNASGIDFLQDLWLPHFRRYKTAIRCHKAEAILFCQPPVLSIPPRFSVEDRQDSQIVYSPHYVYCLHCFADVQYDGLTLINKTWNTWYNVDVLGVLRGRYLSSLFAVKFGLKAIRRCLRSQITAIREEGLDYLGAYPCVISEIGIPFDLDNKRAYSDGQYSSQCGALDASAAAVEGALVGCTFWQYSIENSHKYGDNFNGEDLSFWTTESQPSAQGRAREAFIRPFPRMTQGNVEGYAFDLTSRSFELKITLSSWQQDQPIARIFLPKLHFQNSAISVSDGVTVLDDVQQTLDWYLKQHIGTSTVYSMSIAQRTI